MSGGLANWLGRWRRPRPPAGPSQLEGLPADVVAARSREPIPEDLRPLKTAPYPQSEDTVVYRQGAFSLSGTTHALAHESGSLTLFVDGVAVVRDSARLGPWLPAGTACPSLTWPRSKVVGVRRLLTDAVANLGLGDYSREKLEATTLDEWRAFLSLALEPHGLALVDLSDARLAAAIDASGERPSRVEEPAPPETPTARDTRKRRANAPVVLLLSGIVVLFFVTIVFLMQRKPPPPPPPTPAPRVLLPPPSLKSVTGIYQGSVTQPDGSALYATLSIREATVPGRPGAVECILRTEWGATADTGIYEENSGSLRLLQLGTARVEATREKYAVVHEAGGPYSGWTLVRSAP